MTDNHTHDIVGKYHNKLITLSGALIEYTRFRRKGDNAETICVHRTELSPNLTVAELKLHEHFLGRIVQ